MSGFSSLDELTLRKVNDFVDDDLLSCFLWAAGENAVATPGCVHCPDAHDAWHQTPDLEATETNALLAHRGSTWIIQFFQ